MKNIKKKNKTKQNKENTTQFWTYYRDWNKRAKVQLTCHSVCMVGLVYLGYTFVAWIPTSVVRCIYIMCMKMR